MMGLLPSDSFSRFLWLYPGLKVSFCLKFLKQLSVLRENEQACCISSGT